ncbi:MAG: hypothetical protein GY847_17795, partial [Proteobacteria bacterium]|nr:hypothetical protein [Pseudomonadota bacterium]
PTVAVSVLFSRVSCEHAKEAADVITAMKTVRLHRRFGIFRSDPRIHSTRRSVSMCVSAEFPLANSGADLADLDRSDDASGDEGAARATGHTSADGARRQTGRDPEHEHAQYAATAIPIWALSGLT